MSTAGVPSQDPTFGSSCPDPQSMGPSEMFVGLASPIRLAYIHHESLEIPS